MDRYTRALPTAEPAQLATDPMNELEGRSEALAGRLLDGRYRVLRPLARGGMATVYVALDTRLEREVALKVMHPALAHDPDFVARFGREAKAAARINHPHVVGVSDAGQDGVGADRVVFLVMELVRGPTLRDVLAERGRLPASQALEVLVPVLAALAAAHAAGLVHRDVKPENVLLGQDGCVKVTDFGLARAIEASALTVHGGLLLGTVAYLAPEQVSRGVADARTDVYAAGIVLSEMLTGAVPYTADTPMAVAYQHVHQRVPPPSLIAPGIPAALDTLVVRATQREPEERYVDAGAFLAAATSVRRTLTPRNREATDTVALPLTEHPTHAIRPPPATVTPSRSRRARHDTAPRPARRRSRRWLIAVLILLVLSIGAGVTGWWLGSGRYVRVPSVVGVAPMSAEQRLKDAHLVGRDGSPVYSDTVPAGMVVSTKPVAGARLERGGTVVIHQSSGVLLRLVPSLAGRPLQGAQAALAAAGLTVGSLTHVYDDAHPAGQILAATPAPGSTLRHDSAVAMTVSDGPTPVTLPTETNKPSGEAIGTLRGLGLQVTTSEAFSDATAAGTVIGQDPPGGQGAHHGDTIALVISRGPQLVAVPHLRGKKADDARSLLDKAGLKVNEFDLLGGGNGVFAQTPEAGTKIKPGSSVTIYVD